MAIFSSTQIKKYNKNLLKGLKEMTFIKHPLALVLLIDEYIRIRMYDNKNRFSLFLSYVPQQLCWEFTSRSMGAILLEKMLDKVEDEE